MSRRLVSFFSLLFILTEIQAVAQTTATGHITAEIIPIFTATEQSQLNFGRFSPGPQGGEIILSPESNISVLGSIRTGAGSHNAASFYVSGDHDVSFTISLPSAPVVLKHTGSVKTMVIDDWISKPGTGFGAGQLHDGFQIVYVGAKLKVGNMNDNPVGIYAGTYTITFDFN